MQVILFEVSPKNAITGIPTPIRMCSSDVPSSVIVDDNLFTPAVVGPFPERKIEITDQGFSSTFLPVYFSVKDNIAWCELVWDGAPGRMWVGDHTGSTIGAFTQVYEGIMGSLSRDGLKAEVELYGNDDLLKRDLLSLSYAGTGGAEGPTSMVGRLKPWASGNTKNIEPIVIDPAKWIFQYHGYGATQAIDAVYENSLKINSAGSGAPFATVSTYAALAALTLAPGQWAAAPDVGMFRLGGEPTGKVTADVRGAKNAGGTYVSTTSGIVQHLMAVAGLNGAYIDTTSISAFSQSWDYYADGQVQIDEVIRDAFRQKGGYIFSNEAGVFRAGTYLSSKTPGILTTAALRAEPYVLDVKQVPAPMPVYRVKIGYDRCWSPHSSNEISPALAEAQDDITTAQATANTARAEAATAQATADYVTARDAEFSADNMLSRAEKRTLVSEIGEYTAEKSGLEAQADLLGVTTEKATYQSAYTAMMAYLNGLTPAYNVFTAASTIVRATYLSTKSDFTTARTALISRFSSIIGALNAWTPNLTNVLRSGPNYTKAGGTNGTYDGKLYSSEVFRAGAFTSFKIAQTNKVLTIGLDDSPSTVTNASSILYAFIFASNGTYSTFDTATTAQGAYAANDTFQVTYTGTTVTFLRNNTIVRTVTVAGDQTLGLAAVFQDVAGSVSNVSYSATGATGAAGLNNATVYGYRRSVTSPTPPSATTTYTFSSGVLTGLNNSWTSTIPDANGMPLWTIQATASGTDTTDTIAAGEWSAPMKEQGALGASDTVPPGTLEIDPSNMILDPLLKTDSYWTLTNAAFSTDSAALTAMVTNRMVTNSGTASANISHDRIPVTPRTGYALGAKLLVKAGWSGVARIRFRWYTAAGALLSDGAMSSVWETANGTVAADKIFDLSQKEVAPSGAAFASIYTQISATTGNFFFARPFIKQTLTGGLVDLDDTTNQINDPSFIDTVSWSYSNAVILPTVVGEGGGRNKLRLDASLNQQPMSSRMSLEAGRYYFASSYQKTVSGTTGSLLQQIMFYKADLTASSTAGTIIYANSAGTTGIFTGIFTPPSDAVYATFRWFRNGAGDRIWDVSQPIVRAMGKLGDTVVRETGSVLTDSLAVTGLGTALFIQNQAAAATDPTIATGATKNTTTTATTAPASPGNGDIWHDSSTNPPTMKIRFAGAWLTVANNATNTNQLTDGANLGTTALWGSVASRPTELTDGRVSAALASNGDVARPLPTSIANSSNLLRYTGGAVYAGALNATNNVVTSSSTAPSSPTDGDTWHDNSTTPATTKLRVGGAWVSAATLVTNTNQITDGAGLGTTATWTSVASRPTNLAGLDGTASTKLGTIQTGAQVNPANLAALDSTAATKLGGIEANADVTQNAQITVIPPAGWTLYRTHDGTVKSDQLPYLQAPTVMRGSTEITLDNSVSYSVTGTGGLASKVSVNNTNGSSEKGTITYADTITAAGSAALTVSVSGTTIGTFSIEVKTVNDAAPVNNGSAGGTDNSLEAVTSNSYVVLTNQDVDDPPLEVAITSGQTLKLLTVMSYVRATAYFVAVTALGQYSSDGGTTWTDMGTAVTGSYTARYYNDSGEGGLQGGYIIETGSLSTSWTVAGLATGTYKVRLVGKKDNSSTGNILIAEGYATSSRFTP